MDINRSKLKLSSNRFLLLSIKSSRRIIIESII